MMEVATPKVRGPKIKAGPEEAKRIAVAILDVLAGARTPTQAAESLGISAQRYYQLESRALSGLVQACEPKGRGRHPSTEKELERMHRRIERLSRDLDRKQALVRAAQRAVGLSAAPTPPAGKRKRRRPTVRALKAVEVLRSEPVAPVQATTP